MVVESVNMSAHQRHARAYTLLTFQVINHDIPPARQVHEMKKWLHVVMFAMVEDSRQSHSSTVTLERRGCASCTGLGGIKGGTIVSLHISLDGTN